MSLHAVAEIYVFHSNSRRSSDCATFGFLKGAVSGGRGGYRGCLGGGGGGRDGTMERN